VNTSKADLEAYSVSNRIISIGFNTGERTILEQKKTIEIIFNISVEVIVSKEKLYTELRPCWKINNDFFEIQRSAKDLDFETIGQVGGAGNSTDLLNCFFTGYSPLSGASYYRLVQNDFNSTKIPSAIKSVTFEFISSGVAYPNPFVDHLVLTLQDNQFERIVTVEVYDYSRSMIIKK
jgi:hypothetical protein